LRADIRGNQRPLRVLYGQLVKQLLANIASGAGDQDTHFPLRTQHRTKARALHF
jgi:hypothetical protein